MTDPRPEEIRYLVGSPARKMVFNKPLFTWNERQGGETEMMMWMPKTEEEFEIAQRFYEAYSNIDWDQVGAEGIEGSLVGLPPREPDDEDEDVEQDEDE